MSIQGNKISLNSSGIVRSIDDTEVAKKHLYLCVKQGGSGNSKFVEIVVRTTDDFNTRLLDYMLHINETTIESFNLAEDITNTLSEIINNSFQITNSDYSSKVFLVKTNVATFDIYYSVLRSIAGIDQFINTSAKYINSNYNHTYPIGTIASLDGMPMSGSQIDGTGYLDYYISFIPNFTYDYVQETCDIIPGNDLINTLSIFICDLFINSRAIVAYNNNNELFRIHIELI